MKLHFGYLLGFAALAIAGCAAFFSVYGISQLFVGASTAVIIMGSALELGKLVVASYLQREWKHMNKLMGGYMMTMVIVLMLITSGGIYGFLSSAYQQTNQKFAVNQNEVKFLKQKEKFFSDDVARYETELTRISENISILSNTKANAIQVRDTSSSTGFRNTISTSGLRLAQDRIDVEEENRKDVAAKRSVASDSLQKYQLAILGKQNNSEVSAELGPLIYISNLTGVEMDKVVNWFILLLIFVFDPLAVILVVATTRIFQREGERIKEETAPDKSETIKEETAPDKSETTNDDVVEVAPKVKLKSGMISSSGVVTPLPEPITPPPPKANVVDNTVGLNIKQKNKAVIIATKGSTPPLSGIQKSDIKEIREIRENENNRNFSKKIPTGRRGNNR